ncbi:BSD domain-containing protein C22A12.14c [Phoenix dactylifera]|uniref:BSD domain-containing protein C22A12.14c n=1 Tax=Phoenix dactylifera TaxID=42345 RepID=A0A8B9AYZ3_PHODC|nr:BSD domain-containing protein C22A12.14c [Phoenix dactylifera]
MDFFKSVFAADPDPSPSDSPRQISPPDSPRRPPDEEEERGGEAPATCSPDPNSPTTGGGGGGSEAWSFGGLIKTIASKKELRSLIETYRRDLEEFGSGLKKETAAIREAATRTVRDLPGSLESGASVAQESLESVGQAMDDIGGSVWRGTADIISQSKEALLAMESDANSPDLSSIDIGTQNQAGSSRRYSRFEAQVLAIQSDPSTFSEEPEDAEDFKQWRLRVNLAEKEEEIENLCYENGALEGFLGKLVPTVVNYDTFWSRYYYRVHKLKQAEDARVKLVKRVISREEDEDDLSWEVDDDEEEEENKEEQNEDEKEEKQDEKLRVPKEKEVAEVEENKDEVEKETKKEDTTTSE